ncbi:LysR family transcriptional regulator [Aliiglaciecola sp.]|nr:LysR family transcriptional regulator [Aliiglaciecola sp.]
MKNWQDYQLILSLYRFGTMRGAADELGVNHATISRRLTQLNREYNGLVFERTVDGYKPTKLGKVIVAAALKVEEIDLVAQRDLQNIDFSLAGQIRLSIPPTIGQFLLMQSLHRFTQMYPEIELIVDHSFRLVDLDRAEADIVVRGENSPPDHLVGRSLCQYSLCFYGQQAYLQNTPRSELRWIGKSSDSTLPNWTMGSGYEDVPVGIRLDDISSRHYAAVAGLGLTRGACYMADSEPSLVRLAGCNPIPFQNLWVLTHPHLRNTPRIKLLMTFLGDTILAHQSVLSGVDVN